MTNKFIAVKDVPITKRANYGESATIIAKLASKMFDREPVLALPVKGIQAGRSLARRLKAIATKEGWFLKWSRSSDSKTFYFWIEEADE